ncbi:MAG: TetR/AcrR family transcriptional regulator [Pseudonocardia sp.]
MPRESIWLRPVPTSGIGRPAEWSREQITASAIAVADADGLAAVTMRRVATELGTGAASLYRHLATRGDLLDLMIDHAFGEYEPAPDTGDWRADLVADHLQRLRYLRSRPWLLDAVLDRPPLGPNVVRLVERTLARLATHPASGSAKMETIGVLTGMVQTYAQNERPGTGVLDEDFIAAQAAILMCAVDDGTHPHLAAALSGPGSGTGESADDRLARILRLVLDGLLPEP